MKKLVLTIALVMGFGTTAFAQLTAAARTATADVNVEVVQPLSITVSSDINFGSVTTNVGTVTLGTGGELSSSGGNVTGNGTLGTFDITGAAGATVSISGSLTGPLGGGLTFEPSIIGNTSSLTLTGGAGQVQVGGTLTVGTNATAGSYQGEYTLSVEYTSV